MSSAASSRARSGFVRRAVGLAAVWVCLSPALASAQVAQVTEPGAANGGPADPESAGAVVIKPLESVVPNPASKGPRPPLATADGRFLQRAHASLQARIDLSRLAERSGSHPCVTKFAAGLVDDYAELAKELEVLAAARHLALSGPLPAAERRLLAALQDLGGAAFDRRYAEAMRAALERDLALVRRDGARAADAEIRALAKSLRAKLGERQGMVRDLAAVVGGSGAESAAAVVPPGCAMF